MQGLQSINLHSLASTSTETVSVIQTLIDQVEKSNLTIVLNTKTHLPLLMVASVNNKSCICINFQINNHKISDGLTVLMKIFTLNISVKYYWLPNKTTSGQITMNIIMIRRKLFLEHKSERKTRDKEII